MQLLATDDISDDLVESLREDLVDIFGDAEDDGRMCFRSQDAPSWIRLVADADLWAQALTAGCALYIAELIKEAAKETWKSRAKIVAGAVGAGGRIHALAAKIIRFKSLAPKRVEVVLALPTPHKYFGAQLQISTADPYVLELELALFVHYLPAVAALIETNERDGNKAATGYFLELDPSGALRISWFDRETLKKMETVISLTGDAI